MYKKVKTIMESKVNNQCSTCAAFKKLHSGPDHAECWECKEFNHTHKFAANAIGYCNICRTKNGSYCGDRTYCVFCNHECDNNICIVINNNIEVGKEYECKCVYCGHICKCKNCSLMFKSNLGNLKERLCGQCNTAKIIQKFGQVEMQT